MVRKEELVNNLNNSFSSFWLSKNINIEEDFKSIPTNKFNACMMFVYTNYVNTLEIRSAKGIMKYNNIDFINLIEWYIAKSLDLDKISLFGFSLLINRNVSFLYDLKNNTDSILDFFDYNNCIYDNNNDHIYYNNEVHLNEDREKITLPTVNATKKLFETIQYQTVSKLNDTTIGLVTNANNNKDVGLMYAKERIQEQAKAKALISLSELPRLEEL